MENLMFYVGCYTANGEAGIHQISYSKKDNTFTTLSKNSDTPSPSFVAVHGNFLYAANELSKEAIVSAFAIEKSTGGLKHLNSVTAPGTICCHVTPTDKAVYFANYGTGNIFGIARQQDGSLGEIITQYQHKGVETPRAHSTILSPDKQFLFAADLGADSIFSYKIQSDGGLVPFGQTKVTMGEGPRHMAFHPKGTHLYLVTEYGNRIYTFGYQADTGSLEQLQVTSMPTKPSKQKESFSADIHLSSDGKYLYASVRGTDAIVSYKVLTDGTLEFLGSQSTEGDWPRNFALSPEGDFLLVANQRSNELVLFPRDSETGKLGDSVATHTLNNPACIVMV